MSLFGLLSSVFRSEPRATIPPPPYAFCESVHASGLSPWHIRTIDPEKGLKLGGGIYSDSLCGHVHHGWDLNVVITEHHLGHSCPECVRAFREIIQRLSRYRRP